MTQDHYPQTHHVAERMVTDVQGGLLSPDSNERSMFLAENMVIQLIKPYKTTELTFLGTAILRYNKNVETT